MMSRLGVSLAALCCAGLAPGCAGLAYASDGAPTLPTLALDPQPPTSIWNGFYVGTEVFALSVRGLSRKGSKGFFGGSVLAGYNHEFANNIVVGIEASTGYAPIAFGNGRVHGFDYATTDVKLGYDMGRLMPFVTTGLVLAKPNLGPGPGFATSESLNNLFDSSTPNLQAAGRIGAGFDYALTNNLTFGLSVSVARGQGFIAP